MRSWHVNSTLRSSLLVGVRIYPQLRELYGELGFSTLWYTGIDSNSSWSLDPAGSEPVERCHFQPTTWDWVSSVPWPRTHHWTTPYYCFYSYSPFSIWVLTRWALYNSSFYYRWKFWSKKSWCYLWKNNIFWGNRLGNGTDCSRGYIWFNPELLLCIFISWGVGLYIDSFTNLLTQ